MNDGTQINTTLYRDGFQYYNNVLEFFPHAEGYVKAVAQSRLGYSFNYVFNHTDHLGNIRVRYTKHPQTGEIEILEEDHYYPFGLKHIGYNTNNYVFSYGSLNELITLVPATLTAGDSYKYKYNGKEFQDELGLNWYDYGARNYQPDLGRFMNIDPHAENYFDWSPYNYVGNNPIIRVDPDGKDWDIVINHDNQTITIRGNFTTLSGNEKTLQKAADNWNAQSGKFSYVVGKGDDAISYAVNFEVSVNNPSTDVAENGVQVLSDDNRNFQERTETINGEEITIKPQGVSDGKNFAMKESQKEDSQKTAHEMGHNIGMNHSSGLMGKEGGKNLRKKSVKETLGHSGVGEGVKGSKTNATLQSSTTTGTTPDNFQEGKLKRNRDWEKTKFD